MEKIPSMVDMKNAGSDESVPTTMGGSDYPYGLHICFDDATLEKLNLDDDVSVGDFVHIHALAKVTSVTINDHETMGKKKRIELVLAFISAEDEDDENEDTDDKYRPGLKRYD